MGHYANHLGKKKVAFNELMPIADRVLAMPGMVKILSTEDDAPSLDIPFSGSIVPPGDFKGLVIEQIGFDIRFNFAKVSIADICAEANAVLRDDAAFSLPPWVPISLYGGFLTPEGKSSGKFKVRFPNIVSPGMRFEWDGIPISAAQAACHAVTQAVGLGECRIVGEKIEYTDGVTTVVNEPDTGSGCWFVIPYPDPAAFDPMLVVEALARSGVKIQSVDLSSFIMPSRTGQWPSHEDFRQLWLSLARHIKTPGKGKVSLDLKLESLDSVELIRSALRGKKTYLVLLGQMPTSPGYFANFNVRVHPDGYTFEMRSKDNLSDLLKQIEAITGVPFEEDADYDP